jgi:hypothetical protein
MVATAEDSHQSPIGSWDPSKQDQSKQGQSKPGRNCSADLSHHFDPEAESGNDRSPTSCYVLQLRLEYLVLATWNGKLLVEEQYNCLKPRAQSIVIDQRCKKENEFVLNLREPAYQGKSAEASVDYFD